MSTIVASGFTINSPSSAPTLTNVSSPPGALDPTAVYQYKMTYVSNFGETTGQAGTAQITTSTTGRVKLTNIPVSASPHVLGRKIYRTVGGGSKYLHLHTIEDTTTKEWIDGVADDALGDPIPTTNTASSRQTVEGVFRVTSPQLYSVQRGITATPSGTQATAVRLLCEYNFVETIAQNGDAARLLEITPDLIGLRMVVCNDDVRDMSVFPAPGQDIGDGVNTPVTVLAGDRLEVIAVSATEWARVNV